jgi:signal transduction histidine kinase/ActR/RegA family two-component response regulator
VSQTNLAATHPKHPPAAGSGEYIRGDRIIRLIYPLRIFGCVLTLTILVSVFYERDLSWLWWAAFLAHTVVWPHVAFWIAQSSKDRWAAEMRNLMLDSFIIGCWATLMSFNLLPTVFLTAGVVFDNLTVGGPRIAVYGFFAMLLGMVLTGLYVGFEFVPNGNLAGSIAGAVCIYLYIGITSFSSHRVSRYAIRAKRRLEEEAAALEKARIAADAGNRAKSQFVANMSHELRTPMHAIIGFTDMALRGTSEQKRVEYLHNIDTASRSLLGIINNVLDLSKMEAGKLSLEQLPFEPRALAGRLERLFASQAVAKGLGLGIQVNADVPAVLVGDSMRLEQVLVNLLANALKFTAKGRVDLHIEKLQATPTGTTLRFSVLDTGIGLTPEQQSHLFTPFTQADQSTTRKYGGTGLGLAICQQLVELMGGTIEVQSAAGSGSQFSFEISLGIGSQHDVTSRQVRSEAIGQLPAAQRVRGARVLLAEDNAMNRRLASEILGEAGVALDIAENGQDAVTAVQQNQYDVVLMDMQMPEMDGIEATRAIRGLPGFERLPIIAMTANAMDQDRSACLEAGMNDFLPKPIDAEKLIEKLAQWRDGVREAPT